MKLCKGCGRPERQRYQQGYCSVDCRFWSHVSQDGECWLWTGTVARAPWSGGYGVFSIQNRQVRSHRYTYEILVHEIPAGLDLDHLCRNTLCVNPYHLEPVTKRVNSIRAENGGWQRAKTHCPRGHAYDEKNTRLRTNRKGRGWVGRWCRACDREAAQRKRDAMRAAS